MAYVQKENSGSLFKNDRKEKETHPDYKGDINIGGTNYWLSAWLKEGKNGKFFSLSVNVKEAPGLSKQLDDKPKHKAAVQQVPADSFVDDDIPF
jgi:hypothetical protein